MSKPSCPQCHQDDQMFKRQYFLDVADAKESRQLEPWQCKRCNRPWSIHPSQVDQEVVETSFCFKYVGAGVGN